MPSMLLYADPRSRLRTFPGFVVLLLGVCLVLAGFWQAPTLTVRALAGLLVFITSVMWPEIVLACVVLLGLAGGEYAFASSAGYLVGVLAGVVCLYLLMPVRSAYEDITTLLLPAVVILLGAVRFALEQNWSLVATILRCFPVVLLTFYAVYRKRDVVRAMAWAGTLFAVVSMLAGDLDATGTRLVGISGNPNRMVYGSLLLLPFLLEYLRRPGAWAARIPILGGLAANLYVLGSSGSSQALAGLAVIAIGVLFAAAHRRPRYVRMLIGIIGMTAVGVTLASSDGSQVSDNSDMATLSGRTVLYEAAWNQFLSNPLFGMGTQHVSDGVIVDRSAHSSLLGLLAAGGLVVGIPWLIILVRLSKIGINHLRQGSLIGLSFVVLVVEQFVQSIEFVLITWFVITYAMLSMAQPLSVRNSQKSFH